MKTDTIPNELADVDRLGQLIRLRANVRAALVNLKAAVLEISESSVSSVAGPLVDAAIVILEDKQQEAS